jgi:hypothetical protein
MKDPLVKEVKSYKKSYRLAIFIIFFICGLSIFLFGSNFISTFSTNGSTIYRIIISVIFLVLTVFIYLAKPLRNYWRVSFAFFIASIGTLLNWANGCWISFLNL